MNRRRLAAPRRGIAALALLFALCAAGVSGCADTTASSRPSMSPVPITDFRAVSGQCAGPVVGLAGPREEGDWVKLAIAADGSYNFGVARTIGVFGGNGQFTLQDGKLAMQGDRGRATFTLMEGGGRRRLRGDGVLSSGGTVTADLTPAQ